MHSYTHKLQELENYIKGIDEGKRFEKALRHFRDALHVRHAIHDADVKHLSFFNQISEINSAWLWRLVLKLLCILFVF
jgi:hypothetical protein